MDRSKEVDIIKGLCMITLVFSHAGMKLLWFNYIYVYGFFYVAGYTFREKPFLKFVKSKILGLYIPFIANCLIGLLILFALSKVSHGYFFSRELLDTNIFLIQIPHNLFAPAWFIFPFFIIQFVFFALKKTVKNCNAIFGISFLLYVISYVFNDFLCRFQWNNEYSGLREHPVRVVRATRSVLREPPFPVVRATRIIELRTVVFCTNLL